MRSRYYFIFCLVSVLFPILAEQLTAQPPKPPVGKIWVLNPDMTDEFDAKSPGDKWRVYAQGDSWDRTGAFDSRVHEAIKVMDNGKENYYLAMNPMWYFADEIFTNGKRTYLFAGGGMDTKAMATYGYYEIRIKPSNFPMGSGAFMNSRDYTPGICGEKYKTELDIIENMSYNGPGSNMGFNNRMNINSHVKPTATDCSGLPYISTNGGLGKTMDKPLEFNVVGVWWKDPTTCMFYLNGTYFNTITPAKPFNIPMPLILTMETYTWGNNDENNAGNPKPLEYMFYDEFRPKSQRAVYYDWVRSWQLADIDTAKFKETLENIDFLRDTVKAYPGTNVQSAIICSAKLLRDVWVKVSDSLGIELGSYKNEASVGIQSLQMPVVLGKSLILGKKYKIKCELREAGGDNTKIIKADSALLQVVTEQLVTTLKPDKLPKKILPSTTGYTVEIEYSAVGDLEIAMELRDPKGVWIGGGLSTKVTGKGTASIYVGLVAPTVIGNGYYWKAHIRPVGTGWQQALYGFTSEPFNIAEAYLPKLDLLGSPVTIYKSADSVKFGVDHEVPEKAIINLTLADKDNRVLDKASYDTREGKRLYYATMYLDSALRPGEGYKVFASLESPTGKFSTLFDTLYNVVVKDIKDTLKLLLPLLEIPTDKKNIALNLKYFAQQKSYLNVLLYNGKNEVVGQKTVIVEGEKSTYGVTLYISGQDPSPGYYYVASLTSLAKPTITYVTDTVRGVSIIKPVGFKGKINTEEKPMVYPNPAIYQVHIILPQANLSVKEIVVRDITGKKVYIDRQSIRIENNEIVIGLSSLGNGLYFVGVITNKKSLLVKIVKGQN